RREPIGVCAAIIPWNFPLQNAAWKLAAALAAGNSAVLNPAEQTPCPAVELARVCAEAGVPDGVVNVLPGFGPEAGGPLGTSPEVDKAAFTGPTEAGPRGAGPRVARVPPRGRRSRWSPRPRSTRWPSPARPRWASGSPVSPPAR